MQEVGGRGVNQIIIFSIILENKNRYVFSFISALVDLGIFADASMDFLLVGHTGDPLLGVASGISPYFLRHLA